ncbi:DUF3164 family protein [Caulobacter sp.]|uniref:DUF3164 family protein n=1 Tax=Caulobacter sp. TaxID=78 RepID=UPI002B485395|nr:DUF3164 family protein [Caulobacter sp.]HJV42383.1 DUF3164 family protein [Caulobacter sp.]
MNAFTEPQAIAASEEVGANSAAHPLFRKVSDGVIDVGGVDYMRAGDGSLMPVANMRAQDRLQDELVRKILGFALPLSETIARFVQHTFDDADDLVDLLDQQYGVKRGGKAGNLTFTTFDQLMKVEVTRAKIIDFGPELTQAKALVDQVVADLAVNADALLKGLVTRAFNIENGGLTNRAALLQLLRWEMPDERWRRAMDAIRDAIQVKGTKRYVRIYHRPSIDDQWTPVSLDAARA